VSTQVPATGLFELSVYLTFTAVALLLTILPLGAGLMWLLSYRHKADRAAAVFERVLEPWPVWFYGHPIYHRVLGGLMVTLWLAVTGVVFAPTPCDGGRRPAPLPGRRRYRRMV